MKILTLEDAIWVARDLIGEGFLEDILEKRLEAKATEPSGDLISREAVLNTIDNYGVVLDGNKNYENVVNGLVRATKIAIHNAIDKLPSIQPKKGEWIPVTERLPEDGEKVVVTLEDGDARTMTFYRLKNDWWFETDEGWEYKAMARAWMPSYEEGEKK